MKKMTHADIAAELGLSRSTVTRVLRNDSSVRRETRKRVVDHLNRIGYYNQTRVAKEKILFCYQEQAPILNDVVRQLKGKTAFRNTVFMIINCMKEKSVFLKEAESATILVFFGILKEDFFALARGANPDLYIIHALSGGVRKANISIEPDNTTSGRLAAEYMYEAGHRDLMMVSLANNPSSLVRAKSFVSEFLFRFPECRVEVHLIHGPDPLWEEKFFHALKRRQQMPSGIVCFGCSLQSGLLRQLDRLNLTVPDRISFLSHDNPEDFNAKITRRCDAVIFKLEDILNLVEYFIVHRPLTVGKNNRLSISPEIRLERHGTVKVRRQKNSGGSGQTISAPDGILSKIVIHTTYP